MKRKEEKGERKDMLEEEKKEEIQRSRKRKAAIVIIAIIIALGLFFGEGYSLGQINTQTNIYNDLYNKIESCKVKNQYLGLYSCGEIMNGKCIGNLGNVSICVKWHN